VRGSAYDPFPGSTLPIIYGTLGFRERSLAEYQRLLRENPSLKGTVLAKQLRHSRFNSVFTIDADGKVIGRYHKRVLMPFGEYIPFSDLYPVMKLWMPQTGDFSKGDLDGITTVPLRSGVTVSLAALICYEDLIPALAGEAVQKGAQLLVNFTNDVWYGDTAAPYQHHLLALWRAIETRRYFLRVTNTGYTAVVDPLGKTIAGLPIFTEGVLLEDVKLLNIKTLYAKIGDFPVWVISIIIVLASFFRRVSE